MSMKKIKKEYVKLYWKYYLALENRFMRTEEFVSIEEDNYKTYSFEYLSLLQTICSEIDVVAKAICLQFNPSFSIKNATIKSWGYELQKYFKDITIQRISLRREREITPWEKWTLEERISQRGNPYFSYVSGCDSPEWWKAYEKVKHTRTTIDVVAGRVNYQKANLKNVLYALGALYVLHRLMMMQIDEDMYNFIDKSELFLLPERFDERNVKYFYTQKGYLCTHYGVEDEEEEDS